MATSRGMNMSATDLATTGAGYPRHIACMSCRDRKVKCGGEQPQCQKCRRAGEQCVYLPTQKPTKADLAETVEALQKRLDEAEAYISQLNASSGASITPPSLNNCDRPINPVSQALPPSTVQTPILQSKSVDTQPNGTYNSNLSFEQNHLPTCGPELTYSFLESSMPRQDTLIPYSHNEAMSIDDMNFDFYPETRLSSRRSNQEEMTSEMLDAITAFSTSVFRNLAEVSVMTSLIADYIAWLQKVPSGGGASVNQGPHYVGIMDTIEARLREASDTSRSKSDKALQELLTTLKSTVPPGSSMATRLNGLEDQIQGEAQERAEDFRSRYNICALLTEQARNLPK